MRVKIGNEWFDSDNSLIMIELSETDKKNIAQMPEHLTKYTLYDKNKFNHEDIQKWMNDELYIQLASDGSELINGVDLNVLAAELTKYEGLGKSINIAQVKELLGVIGYRWRNMTDDQVHEEINSIITKAGIHSKHNVEDLENSDNKNSE